MINLIKKLFGVVSVKDISCPKVNARICCEDCSYPLCEAQYIDHHEAGIDELPCKYDLIKNI